ncbi:MAG TPA: HAD family hydrolase [Dyadobacter sp.]|jgi:HAD superfamily hydrolase (TIGR01490 family)|nr:HAD family hydrolase [Dyadobacter sp.]
MKKGLALFDFDGTVTHKDSFLYFLLHTHSIPKIVFNALLVSPQLIAYKLGFMTNEAAKMELFSAFYKGKPKERFDSWAAEFRPKIDAFTKTKALGRIQFHKERGDRVIVVSAGFDQILKHWCDKEGIELIATRVEIENNVITGRFNGPNCYGKEKVNRVKALLNIADYEEIYAYGDSAGDIEMMEIATNPLRSKRIFE